MSFPHRKSYITRLHCDICGKKFETKCYMRIYFTAYKQEPNKTLQFFLWIFMQNLVQKRKKVTVPQTKLYTGLAICAEFNCFSTNTILLLSRNTSWGCRNLKELEAMKIHSFPFLHTVMCLKGQVIWLAQTPSQLMDGCISWHCSFSF